MVLSKSLKELKEKALSDNIPIIMDDSLEYIINFIKKNNIKTILEIGTAVGYSSIMFANINKDIKIISIERDQNRYLEALKNVKSFNLEDQIKLVYNDALNVNLEDKFDLIFIDASKSQNINFFNKFINNLNDSGYVITDNMFFHGMVSKLEEEIESKNVRGIVRKIKEYKKFIEEDKNYASEMVNLGDGLFIITKKDNM